MWATDGDLDARSCMQDSPFALMGVTRQSLFKGPLEVHRTQQYVRRSFSQKHATGDWITSVRGSLTAFSIKMQPCEQNSVNFY